MNISEDISIDNIQTKIFNGKLKNNVSVCNLNYNNAIVCYTDHNNGNYGTACILDIYNNTIISESEVIFNHGDSSDTSVSRLTYNKAIVCYRDCSNDEYGTACILDINLNNNIIIPGNTVVFNNRYSNYFSVVYLTDNKAIVCYRDNINNGYGTACILNINNNIIIPENTVVFNSRSSYQISVSRLNDNKVIAYYRNIDNYCESSCILAIDNNTIIPENSPIFNKYNDRISVNKAIISYPNYNNDHKCICILNTENNNILNKYEISSNIIRKIFIRKINNKNFIICYNTNNTGFCEIIKIENNNIILNKYGIIIDNKIESINHVSEVYNNKVNIFYNKDDITYNQEIGMTHEYI